jgi:hypothetical protein
MVWALGYTFDKALERISAVHDIDIFPLYFEQTKAYCVKCQKERLLDFEGRDE